MTGAAVTFQDLSFQNYARAPRRRPSSPSRLGSAVLAIGVVAGAGALYVRLTVAPSAFVPSVAPPRTMALALPPVMPAPEPVYDPLFDPTYSLGALPVTFDARTPLAPTFVGVAPPAVAAFVPAPAADDAPVSPLVTQLGEPDEVPLPLPRPPFARPRVADGGARPAAAPEATAATGAPDAGGSFLERLFGAAPSPRPALAYAAPEDGAFAPLRRLAIPAPAPAGEPGVAVYDISARTVTLPNGTRLEAHSGLGELLDDPNHVDARNRGATPPHLYDLTLREKLFHGVQALRLTPIGEGSVYGRDGLLAHRFMLGPNGDSNGCVSFRDYEAFLQAYQTGQVRRLLVVARR